MAWLCLVGVVFRVCLIVVVCSGVSVMFGVVVVLVCPGIGGMFICCVSGVLVCLACVHVWCVWCLWYV